MNGHTIYKKISCTILLVGAIALGLGFTSITFSQAQRNPVLEFSTGTWCQWCPCGDQAAQDILAEIPNAIILAYHGPPNSSYDPFSFFAGNTIIYAFDFPGYPTGVVDRLTGIVDYFYGGWAFSMNIRLNVPATVSIDLVNSSYERATREFNATIDFTALQNLSGEYKYSAILVEDGVVYGQSSN
ncbi:MAG: hypothetical protein ACE5HX_07275 [bacterium]